MANYSIIANSTFQPFTYQELAAPLDRQELYHEKLAEEYDKLSSQADVLEALGADDRDKNSGSYSRYKAYSDALRKEADDLYRFGLNTESRQRLSDLRRKYNTEIVPIQNAWNKRDQESREQTKARLQNPSLMFTRDARTSSLDDYISNPTGGYGVINGANITAQMAGMAKNLAKQIRNGSASKENIDDYTYRYIERFGLDENLIRNWQDSPTLKRMFGQVMQANGVTPEALSGSMNAQDIINKSAGYAEMGMWNAMGEDKSTVHEDFLDRLQVQAEKEAYVAMAKKGGVDANGMPTITSDGVGLESSEHYYARGLQDLGALKGGKDGLKASYFGRQQGQVNPMKVYEEYQQELKKHRIQGNSTVANVTGTAGPNQVVYDEQAAKRAVLEKYRKYGVTDVLSENQYGLLKDMGYNSTDKNPGKGGARFSNIENGFNNLVKQKNRYSVNMTKYDNVDEDIRGNLASFSKYNQLSGRLWHIEKNGKEGSPIKDADGLNLYSADNTKGNKVNGIYYDPQFKGKIVFRTSDGERYTATPDIINNEVARMIRGLEADGAPANAIAAALYEALNSKNKVQGETDSKI